MPPNEITPRVDAMVDGLRLGASPDNEDFMRLAVAFSNLLRLARQLERENIELIEKRCG